MDTGSTRQRPSSPSSDSGFTLTELMVGMAVMLLVTGAALSLSLSSRRAYETDEARTHINQNLRAGIDLLGLDVRQAGERLPPDFPALLIADGAAGAPDTLVLRRNLLDAVLPVCEPIVAGSTVASVLVADNTAPPPGCAPVSDSNADGWPDNMEAWRAHRLANGGAVTAYLFNPATGNGEFILYDTEDAPTFSIHKTGTGAWLYNYAVSDQPRVYMLEERIYEMSADLLQMRLSGTGAPPIHLVDRIRDFQTKVVFANGTEQDTLSAADEWSDIRSIAVTLSGMVPLRGRTIQRQWTTEFCPRNVLSH